MHWCTICVGLRSERCRAGIPAKQARLISGHKTDSVFDRYDIVDERDIELAGQKLAMYLERKEELVSARFTDREVRTEQELDASIAEPEGFSLQ